MVRKVVHSARSIGDVKAICERVSADNPDAALKLGEDLLAATARLAEFPKIGRFCKSFARGELRELVCRGYRIFYLAREGSRAVEVVHIRHCARDEPGFLD